LSRLAEGGDGRIGRRWFVSHAVVVVVGAEVGLDGSVEISEISASAIELVAVVSIVVSAAAAYQYRMVEQLAFTSLVSALAAVAISVSAVAVSVSAVTVT